MVVEKSEKPSVAIIGAGFSGLCSFIQLQKQLGIEAQLFELSDDIGGTWKQNVYPGCSCDLPSHIYTLSTDLNPNWTMSCSSQSEILAYMQDVAKRHKIYEHTQLNTEVVRATWLKDRYQWQLDIKKNEGDSKIESVFFDILISGMGGLRVPNIPSEFKAFSGPTVHTAAWDWSMDYKDKRIAIIGSGSSACQAMSFLAENASKVVSYQRNPAWVLPRDDFQFPEFVKWIFTYIPFTMVLYRLYIFYRCEILYPVFGYPDSFLAQRTVKTVEKNQKEKLLKANRPDLVEILKPSYRFGCKRVVFSSEYLDAITKPNVSVIRSPIKTVEANTIVNEDGQTNEFDILVLATGYKTQQGILGNIKIVGEENKSLTDSWDKENPQFYNSVVINGFPNMFMLLGPTSILGHHSVLSIIEIQVNYSIKCIKELILKKNMSAIEPTPKAQEEYMAKWKSDFKGTVWTASCTSWYKNKSGEITSLYPNTVSRFSWTLGKVKEQDFVVHPPRI